MPGVSTAGRLTGDKREDIEEGIGRYVGYAKGIAGVRRYTISALIYPAILLSLSVVVVAIIVLRVVPEFGDLYAGLGAELPWGTRLVMAVSTTLRAYFLLILAALGGAIALGWAWIRQPGRGAALDRLLLQVPTVGAIARKFATSQLARTLATLLGGGIPLVNALDVAARSIGNRHVAVQLDVVAREVREGKSLSAALGARGIFPPVALKMVEVGESTGALQEMLRSVADFFDEEIETSLTRFMTPIEPLLLVIMGVVIASRLLSLYMPLIQLGSLVS